ncbi:MAG: amylo-alpha-1,6-glucosidase [Candidatus Sulfotelmatobacter sp.]
MQDVIQVESHFYILASSSLADDRTRVLKHGETFLVFNRVGDIGGLVGEQGLFHEGTRHLSRYLMKLAGRSPQLLRSTVRDDNAGMTLEVMNTDVYDGSRLLVQRGSLHLFRSMFLWESVCYDKLRLSNFSMRPVDSELSLQFAADYADIFQVRGTKRELVGEMLPPVIEDDSLTFAYQGRDGILRRTRIQFSPAPSKLTKDSALFSIHLDPREETTLKVNIVCEQQASRRRVFDLEHAMAETLRSIEHANSQFCRISSSSPFFNRWLTRSEADLEMMISGNPEGAYPYAGVPWYNTVFGRDGILTAMECLWATPWIAASVLKYLAQTQATEVIPEQEAEPGKIVHEIRHGEMANLKEVPFGLYYGTVDATPLFVMLADAYLERTGDRSLIRDIWPHILAALDWIDTYGDADHDGFVEYKAKSGKGLVHQGWKDSYDSISHQNGDLAQPPIALCEVQGYVYAARQAGARIAAQLGQVELARKLSAQANSIQEQFEEKFWDDELNTYVIALDGSKSPCRVLNSNAGHCLFTGISRPEHAARLVNTLMGDQLYCGWGIRTLGSRELRYNPMSYHNGSVWPHDNAIIARGLARYGYKHEASQILTALFDASMFMPRNRLPELFCGFHRRTESEGPTLYPVACSPQAWSSAAAYLLLQACLGIELNSAHGSVSFSSPYLPERLSEIRFSNLRLGASSIDIALHRDQDKIALEILRNEGGVNIQLYDPHA